MKNIVEREKLVISERLTITFVLVSQESKNDCLLCHSSGTVTKISCVANLRTFCYPAENFKNSARLRVFLRLFRFSKGFWSFCELLWKVIFYKVPHTFRHLASPYVCCKMVSVCHEEWKQIFEWNLGLPRFFFITSYFWLTKTLFWALADLFWRSRSIKYDNERVLTFFKQKVHWSLPASFDSRNPL